VQHVHFFEHSIGASVPAGHSSHAFLSSFLTTLNPGLHCFSDIKHLGHAADLSFDLIDTDSIAIIAINNIKLDLI